MQEKREKSVIFRDFITNLKVCQLRSIKSEILATCGVSKVAYCKWLRGMSVPTKTHQQIINEVAIRYGYQEIYQGK